MPLSANVDLETLRRDRRIGFYFRYPLRRGDFWPVRAQGRLCGYATAKPLYRRLTPQGRVDRSSGYDGRVAILFIPSPARSTRRATLLFTHLPSVETVGHDGRRNWPALRAAAERAVHRHLGEARRPVRRA